MTRLTLSIAVILAFMGVPAAFAQAPEVLVGTLYSDMYYGDTPAHLRVWGDGGGYTAAYITSSPAVYVSYPRYYGGYYGSYYGSYPGWSARNTSGAHVIFGSNAYITVGNPCNVTDISVGTGSGYYYGWPVTVSRSTRCDRPSRTQCAPGYGGNRDPACRWTNRNLDIVRRSATSPIYRTRTSRYSTRGSFRTGSTYRTQPQWGLSRVDRTTGRSAGILRPSVANSLRNDYNPYAGWSQSRSIYRGSNVSGQATRQAVPGSRSDALFELPTRLCEQLARRQTRSVADSGAARILPHRLAPDDARQSLIRWHLPRPGVPCAYA